MSFPTDGSVRRVAVRLKRTPLDEKADKKERRYSLLALFAITKPIPEGWPVPDHPARVGL